MGSGTGSVRSAWWGGSVYDALVGQAALHNERVLLTRDRRAERTYRALGVRYQPIDT